ncbi:hypothetical protein SAMN04488071_3585 [Kordiimonas lacus]|uniref:DKNYY family protein n=2 Tax=Kordiimonas lacus TaxID=637679 RepID=A0A1G7F298_9PROT|nr:hypothetical protein SAMN04488071_3585 [Kordiimonas lacus]
MGASMILRALTSLFLAIFLASNTGRAEVPPPVIEFVSIDRAFSISRQTDTQNLLKRLQESPLGDDDIRQELIDKKDEIPPAFLFHLAERTFPINKTQAIEWYWLGFIRARLDAVLCADTTAAQGVSFLPGFARSVSKYVRDNPKDAGEAGLRVLNGPDLLASKASPWWICSHGIRAMNNAIKGALRKKLSPEEVEALGLPLGTDPAEALAWLIPEAEMAARYKKILDGTRSTFERLTQPTEETVEKLTLKAVPNLISTDRAIVNLFWANDGSLLLLESIPREPRVLHKWDGTSLEPMYEDIGIRFCFADDYISYSPKPLQKDGPKPKYDPTAPKKLTIKEGRLGRRLKTTEVKYTERSVASGGFQSGPARSPGFARLGQSSLTCKWIRTPDSGDLPQNANIIMDLGRRRGLLESVKDGTYHYPFQQTEAVKISDQTFPLRCMKYLHFADAIQMLACPYAYVDYKGRKQGQGLKNVSLLRVQNEVANLETINFDEIPGERGNTQTLYTKRGIIRLMPSRHTVVGKKAGGLYFWTDGQWKKIWEGFPLFGDVSADGCHIAFSAGDRPNGMQKVTEVRALDICEALPGAG